MKRPKLRMSDRAELDLDRLQKNIAALGAPRTAKAFVSRLKKYVNTLRDFPEIGAAVEEYDDPSIREINFRGQRILYRYAGDSIVILTVFHASHVPNLAELLGD